MKISKVKLLKYRKKFKKWRPIKVIIILILATVGTYLLININAQSPYASTEAESGAVNCQAIQDKDPNASGGAYVQFGPTPTTVTGTTSNTSTAVALSVPTHFDDTWWNWPSSTSGYSDYTINITPEADGSPDGYFFSSFFIFVNGGTPYTGTGVGYGYLGLQTEAEAGFTGKDDIFSIWGATSASDAQYMTTFTEGSSGWSGRNSYPWVVGSMYTLKVGYLSTQSDGEHWEAWVTDDSTCVTSEIGQLVVPTSFGMLSNVTVSFHERYAGPVTSCSVMQRSDVEFTDPLFDDSITPTGYTNYPANVTGCTADYGVEDIPGGFRSVIGGSLP